MDFSFDNLNYNSVENVPCIEARAAFTVNSATVFKEDVDIVQTIDKQLRYVYQLITDEFSCKLAQSSNLFDPMPKEPPDIDEKPVTVYFWCHLSNIFASNRSEACAIEMQTFNDCIHYMSGLSLYSDDREN